MFALPLHPLLIRSASLAFELGCSRGCRRAQHCGHPRRSWSNCTCMFFSSQIVSKLIFLFLRAFVLKISRGRLTRTQTNSVCTSRFDRDRSAYSDFAHHSSPYSATPSSTRHFQRSEAGCFREQWSIFCAYKRE